MELGSLKSTRSSKAFHSKSRAFVPRLQDLQSTERQADQQGLLPTSLEVHSEHDRRRQVSAAHIKRVRPQITIPH